MSIPLQPLLLASNSPRRTQLLSLCGWEFSISPADVDEQVLAGEAAPGYVRRLAESKARRAATAAPPGRLVVAADTTVADGGRILGKPQDADEARQMLESLCGHAHQVFTAVAVFDPSSGRLLVDLCQTDVPMRDYSAAELEAYVASGDPLDKAGAYAIQHAGFHPVENLQGCFANVMGLPLCHLERTLRKMGIVTETDVPAACQAALEYECPVYQQVRAGGL